MYSIFDLLLVLLYVKSIRLGTTHISKKARYLKPFLKLQSDSNLTEIYLG